MRHSNAREGGEKGGEDGGEEEGEGGCLSSNEMDRTSASPL